MFRDSRMWACASLRAVRWRKMARKFCRYKLPTTRKYFRSYGFLGNPPRPQVTYCTLAGTHIPVVPLSTKDSLSTCTIGSLFHGRLSQNGRKYIISYPHMGYETAERLGRQIRTETLAISCCNLQITYVQITTASFIREIH